MAVDHVGREIELEALGRPWRFARWDREVWVKFADWARTQLPDPLEVATKNIDKVMLKDAEIIRELRRRDDEEFRKAAAEGRKAILLAETYKQVADVIVEAALAKATNYLSFNSPELQSLMRSTVGCSYCLWLLLTRHQPDVSLDDAYEIFMALAQQRREKDDPAGYYDPIEKIIATTQGRAESKPKNG